MVPVGMDTNSIPRGVTPPEVHEAMVRSIPVWMSPEEGTFQLAPRIVPKDGSGSEKCTFFAGTEFITTLTSRNVCPDGTVDEHVVRSGPVVTLRKAGVEAGVQEDAVAPLARTPAGTRSRNKQSGKAIDRNGGTPITLAG